MSKKISVIINTLNEEQNISRAIKSVSWADEIIVCDMYSEDNTVQVAKKLGAKIVYHKRTGYVEPARNFTISKTDGDWILVLDADEEVPKTLTDKLKEIVLEDQVDFVRIPRRNIIFGKWMKNSMWWPDYNVRFFKKGMVFWTDKIHIPPQTIGKGQELSIQEQYAIIHHHYLSLTQFVERNSRYSKIQAQNLLDDGYKFRWQDLIKRPTGEFLSRFFANRGFEDGLHGLALSLLQGFMFLLQYLYVWELEGFKQKEIDLKEIKKVTKETAKEIDYWFKYGNLSDKKIVQFFQRVKNKLL